MSTQHSNNAFMPAFVSDAEGSKGEDEIVEADCVLSVLGLASLSVKDLQFLEAMYPPPHFRADVTAVARYANLEVIHRV